MALTGVFRHTFTYLYDIIMLTNRLITAGLRSGGIIDPSWKYFAQNFVIYNPNIIGLRSFAGPSVSTVKESPNLTRSRMATVCHIPCIVMNLPFRLAPSKLSTIVLKKDCLSLINRQEYPLIQLDDINRTAFCIF